MKMSNQEYSAYVNGRRPHSPLGTDMLKAFLVGGLICTLGEAITQGYASLKLGEEEAGSLACITLIFLGVALTAVGVFDDIARFAGAGTLVPITGFANSIAAPAIEFKVEGLITGACVKMFTIAGPVITCGVSASILYGLALCLLG